MYEKIEYIGCDSPGSNFVHTDRMNCGTEKIPSYQEHYRTLKLFPVRAPKLLTMTTNNN
jgi:hypothetical protein